MSLEKEPVVFQVPDFADRFWVYQLGNQRTDTIGGMGKMYDSKPGFYMVVGPDWKGEVPAGINSVFRSPTNLAYIIPRAFLDDTKEDRAAIQPVLNQMGGLRSDIACTRFVTSRSQIRLEPEGRWVTTGFSAAAN